MDQADEKQPLNFLSDDFMFAAINIFLTDAGLLAAEDGVKGDFIEAVAADLVEKTNLLILDKLTPTQLPEALKIASSELDYAGREAALSALIPDFKTQMKTLMDLLLRKVRLGEYSKK